jgi:hypothetical protein
VARAADQVPENLADGQKVHGDSMC